MKIDLWNLYEHMLRSRRFEEAVAQLWRNGHILGEMHLGIGEEAIAAGTVLQLQDGDAMALDHRGTAPLLMRGISADLLIKELLGQADGLCGGKGGHMHLFSREYLSASSGIVGASAPAAVGFGLAAQQLNPGNISLAFFGEGAMNQGMLLESFNLAVAWKLPVIFICKNSKWAITTFSKNVTGGKLLDRPRSFGIPSIAVDGNNVRTVWRAAGKAIKRARSGKGPSFIMAKCYRPDGHFLGDPLLRITRNPAKEIKKIAGPLMKSVTSSKGTGITRRAGGLGWIGILIGRTIKDQVLWPRDPLKLLKKKLKGDKERLEQIDASVSAEIAHLLTNSSKETDRLPSHA